MTKTEFLLQIDELLEQTPGTLQGPETLVDYGWDSLAVVSFIAMVHNLCQYVVPPEQLARCKTVNDVIGLLGDRFTASQAAGGAG
jgi:acyl carrier protein